MYFYFTNATDPDKLSKLRAKKMAPGTQTGATNVDDNKGAGSVKAQSLVEEAPMKWLSLGPAISMHTKIPFRLKKMEAVKWLTR
jgi:hypothetical protein